jgi:hypothetical protein
VKTAAKVMASAVENESKRNNQWWRLMAEGERKSVESGNNGGASAVNIGNNAGEKPHHQLNMAMAAREMSCQHGENESSAKMKWHLALA